MGDGFIIRRGGGKLEFFTALIKVTYPEGSVCTCSNGSKTLKAKGTSGKYLFNVEPGTWTVSCTDGTDTASQSVEIASAFQTASVELAYGFYIFKSGEGAKIGLTAFKENSSNIVTIGTDNIVLSYTGEEWCSGVLSDLVDITSYNTLHMIYTCSVVGGSAEWKTAFGVTSNASYTNGQTTANALNAGRKTISKSTTLKTDSLDISKLSGNYRIGVYGANKTTVYNLWLE